MQRPANALVKVWTAPGDARRYSIRGQPRVTETISITSILMLSIEAMDHGASVAKDPSLWISRADLDKKGHVGLTTDGPITSLFTFKPSYRTPRRIATLCANRGVSRCLQILKPAFHE